jgi:hypothetical protein
MVAGWTAELAAKAARHLDRILDQPEIPLGWESVAAKRTKCLPVYTDLSGTIVLSTSGELFFCDGESQTVTPLGETLWRRVAIISLIEKYPDLSELLPVRPSHASICPICSGAGKLMNGRLFCGNCGGAGWIEQTQNVDRFVQSEVSELSAGGQDDARQVPRHRVK